MSNSYMVPAESTVLPSAVEDNRTPNTVYIVNSENDANDGNCDVNHCSLREAINAANNSSGFDVIRFAFTTATTIQPENSLPTITGQVTIDGLTGTDSNCPTSASAPADLTITIDGINANTSTDGLVLADGSSGSTIMGLNIVRFDGAGISITADSPVNTVICSQLGVPNADTGGYANGDFAIRVASLGNEIGGNSHADRNVIVGTRGIHITGNLNAVSNNYIGTTRDGSTGLGVIDASSIGVFINSDANAIGEAAVGNVISGYATGIRVLTDNSSNSFRNNKIGTDRTGNSPIPNTIGMEIVDATGMSIGGASGSGNVIAFNNDIGISFDDSADVTISHNIIHNNGIGIDSLSGAFQLFNDDNIIADNQIYNNAGDGIRLRFAERAIVQNNDVYSNGGHGINIDSADGSFISGNSIFDNGLDGIYVATFSTANEIRSNSIYDNGDLGIDLGSGSGITANDTKDVDDGGNNRQNFPVLVSADNSGLLSGIFERDPSNTFAYTNRCLP